MDCTPNLTDSNVARRLRVGITALAVGLATAVVFRLRGASPAVELLLFVPFFISANSFFQAMFMTCGYSALAGVRHTPQGTERIADKQELRLVRSRGLKQIGFAFLCAAALTASFAIV
jgi:hypothetical protein